MRYTVNDLRAAIATVPGNLEVWVRGTTNGDNYAEAMPEGFSVVRESNPFFAIDVEFQIKEDDADA